MSQMIEHNSIILFPLNRKLPSPKFRSKQQPDHFQSVYKTQFTHPQMIQSKTASLLPNIALMHPLLLCAVFSLLSITTAQDRSPHGLAHENPMAFSPSAFEFFHPDNRQPSKVNPCAASGCSPLPVAATVQSSLAYASRSTQNRGGSGIRAGGIAGIIFGFVFVVLLAMGVYYVVIKRRANMSKNNSAQAEA